MTKIIELEPFIDWLDALRDARARERIVQRVVRLGTGLLGDWKSVGGAVSELRIDYGPGYRVYFSRRGDTIILLLCGGDKGSQQRDIDRARRVLAEWIKGAGDEGADI